MSYEVGTRVETEKNGKGCVAFSGTTQFADGEWVGVILDDPKGKNNGTVHEVQYFQCEPSHGLFVRATQLKLEGSRGSKTTLKAPTAVLRKDSSPGKAKSKLSPGSSPKMSPAASVERLSKAPGKSGSTSRLADMGKEKPPAPKEDATPAAKETVQSRAKKIEEVSTTMAPPSPVVKIPAGMDDPTEKEYLLVQVKDLTEKLETLRMKRKEDHAKLTEFDRQKLQLVSLQEVRQKMADQVLDLQRQLLETQKEKRDLEDWRAQKQDEMGNSGELLEMATIDKEMAEERVESLQKELDHWKETSEGLEAELEILKMEMETADGGDTQVNSIQLKQVEQKNERLMEALIKLRDIVAEAQAEKASALKECEILRLENTDLIRLAEASGRAAEEGAQRILELQEQIEAAMGAEEMIVALTSKNLGMEDKIQKLEQDLEDLEALRDMDEQLAEAQKQVEKDLLKDIEFHQVRINELLSKIKAEEKHSDDLMETIIKFRAKTGEQNEEIQDLKDQILRYEDQLNGVRSEESSVASMASQLNANNQRTFAESMERQINAIELEYSKKQNGYLKAFLPDNFTKPGGDNDSVLLNVLFPRLASKAKLLAKMCAERFPGVPGGTRREHVTKSHKAEQWAMCARINVVTAAMTAVCGQFESAMQSLSLEGMARLSQLQPEMTVQERQLDSYLDLLKTGRLDENTSLDSLQKAVAHFQLLALLIIYLLEELENVQNVLSVHVGSEGWLATDWVAHTLRQVQASLTSARVNTQRVTFFLAPGSEDSDVGDFVRQLNDELVACEQETIKASKRVPTEKRLKLTPLFTDELNSSVMQLDRLCCLLHETCSVASVQININAEMDGFEASRMKEMIHGAVEKFSGAITLEKAFEPPLKFLSVVRDNLISIGESLEGGLMEEAPTTSDKKSFPPMLERAHQRKQAAAEAEGLRWQLEKKDQEILEIKKNLKARLDDISKYKLRLDMAEAREHSSGRAKTAEVDQYVEKMESLQKELKRQTIEFDEQQDALQKMISDLSEENNQLKQNQKNMSKRVLLQNIQSMETRASAVASTASSPNAGGIHRADLQLLEMQLQDYVSALKSANMEISKLRGELNEATDKSVVLKVPDMVCGPETLHSKEQSDSVLDAMIKEAEQLQRDENYFYVYTPDYSRSLHIRNECERQWKEDRERYFDRIDALRVRVHRYWKAKCTNKPIPLLFGILDHKRNDPKYDNIKFGDDKFNAILKNWGVCY